MIGMITMPKEDLPAEDDNKEMITRGRETGHSLCMKQMDKDVSRHGQN